MFLPLSHPLPATPLKETFGGDGYVHYLDNFFKVKLEEAEKGGTDPVKVIQKY